MKCLLKGTYLFAVSMILSSAVFNVSYADDSAPKFNCTLTDQVSADKQPGDAKNAFTKGTAVIYLVCDSDNVKKGQTIKSVWIAADTHNVAPNNYKIDEKALQVADNMTDDQKYTANFSLSKPNNGWPVGSYHVDLYVDNQLIQSVKFSVN